MATERVEDPTNPTNDEVLQVMSGKLAAKETQLSATEIKIEKRTAYIRKLERKVAQLEKKRLANQE